MTEQVKQETRLKESQPEKPQEEKGTINPPSSLIESGSQKDPIVITEPKKQNDSYLEQQFQPERQKDPQNVEFKENEQQQELEIIISLQSDSDQWYKIICPDYFKVSSIVYNFTRHYSEVHKENSREKSESEVEFYQRKDQKSKKFNKGQKRY